MVAKDGRGRFSLPRPLGTDTYNINIYNLKKLIIKDLFSLCVCLVPMEAKREHQII